MTNQATTLPQVEDLMLEFAYREFQRAEARWQDKQMSDDYAYTNGSMPAYTAQIEHWGMVAATICSNWGLDRPADITRYRPFTPAEVDKIATAHESKADKATEQVHDFEDANPQTLDSTHSQQYIWLLGQAKEAKRLANFYAYLCKRPHPFAGIDMLPADIG